GATETGRPYFVMELVQGIAITEYCDANELDTRERLDLFLQVCNAVQHAHQKGIIHRDLKPSNVMVTQRDGTPISKVIDFGIAKATNQRLTEKTLFTRYAHIIGTPAYMSPEQAELSELDVDTRTDIYSLGVLLYELLTGTTPFGEEELRKAGYLEMQRVICEEEPTKPSTKLSTLGPTLTEIAKRHRSTPDLLRKAVRGDLDWIVMKSLEKDRGRRYETANELAMDIERHLGDEPVLAGPPSAGYRLGKFARRNRVAVIAGSLVGASLLAVAVVSAMYARHAERARQNAVQTSREISGLLAGSYVDRAQALCEHGEVGRGMLWLAHSLQVAPDGSTDLGTAVRMSLAAWHGQLHSLGAVARYPDKINAVAFSPDGSRVLAACADGTARLCDAATGRQIGEPMRHESHIWAVAVSPSGARIATGDRDGSVRLWDAATLESVGESMHHEKVRVMAFSPDGSRLATAGADGAVRLWDSEAGKSLGEAFRHVGTSKSVVRTVAFCLDGLRAVVTVDLGIHQMFDADRGEPIGPPVRHPDTLAVAIDPRGTRFATAGYHSVVRVWDAATGELAYPPMVHGGVMSALAFSPDGSRIVSGGNTRIGLLWDAATGQSVGAALRQRGTVRAVAFSPDGTRVVTGNENGEVLIWNLVRGKPAGRPVRHENEVVAAAYGPQGLRILTRTNDLIQVRQAKTDRPLGKAISHTGQFTFHTFSPDGSRFMTQGAGGGRLQLWDIATGEPVGQTFHRWAMCVAFSPDGSRILTGGQDNVARLWDAATLELLHEFQHHRKTVSGVAFSPDGSRFLTGSFDGTTQLWDAVTLEPLGERLIHQSEVQDLAFSPDGERILIGFADGTVRLWDAETLRPIGTPLQHVKIVCSVAFSPDGSQLLACSMENSARLWDVATLKPIGPPLEHDVSWPRASFSPDGSEILLVDKRGTAAVWDAPPGPLDGDCERITCWVQVVTGTELDPTGGINVLDAPTWQQRRRRLEELGGPPELTMAGL
ncbi:MAG: serine/threonine protein kinase, partial [Phycisphaerales bacterium]